ncbi:ABC transporter permease [Georgenia sp. TF02-10]|uniref:ABC transporter permease n=1 Tax=Georgenia sp. TF02-10 TaxID=2917725 RepID=UPI001FA76886|nr:ABC transporter permease [Georgenia sp. TF02-10]UNX53806.1 ABC transporter permease [Georgenia sp. TF02-10]
MTTLTAVARSDRPAGTDRPARNRPTRTRRARTAPLATPGLALASVVFVLVVLAALVPQLFTSIPQEQNDLANAMQGPSAEHWLGTDQLGRDVYSRIVYGARYSLLIGLGATAIAIVLGTLIGLVSALGGRVVDAVAMRLVDVALAFPELLLALVVIAVIGPGAVNALFAIGIASVPSYARLVRSEALVVRRSGYVEAASALGLRPLTLVRRHIVPNVLGPLLVLATIGVGTAVLAGSALSFLGLGPEQPTPEWGALLNAGRDYLSTAWWIGLFPGLAITLTVVSVTLIGRRLQARFEGRDA